MKRVTFAIRVCWKRRLWWPMARVYIWAVSSKYPKCWRMSKWPGIITPRTRDGEWNIWFAFIHRQPIAWISFVATRFVTRRPNTLRPPNVAWLWFPWTKPMVVGTIAIWAARFCAATTLQWMPTGKPIHSVDIKSLTHKHHTVLLKEIQVEHILPYRLA